MMLYMEICRSKSDSLNVTLNTGTSKSLMKTASTSLHLINSSYAPVTHEDDSTMMVPNHSPDTYLGDSWFTSMDVMENVSGYYIGNLKSNSSRYPKKYLQDTMKEWPSGSYLNLKTILNADPLQARTV